MKNFFEDTESSESEESGGEEMTEADVIGPLAAGDKMDIIEVSKIPYVTIFQSCHRKSVLMRLGTT
jgi:hypothetical protein